MAKTTKKKTRVTKEFCLSGVLLVVNIQTSSRNVVLTRTTSSYAGHSNISNASISVSCICIIHLYDVAVLSICVIYLCHLSVLQSVCIVFLCYLCVWSIRIVYLYHVSDFVQSRGHTVFCINITVNVEGEACLCQCPSGLYMHTAVPLLLCRRYVVVRI